MINHTSTCVFITRLMRLSKALQTWLRLAVAIYCGGALCMLGPLGGVGGWGGWDRERKEKVGRKTSVPCSWILVSRYQGVPTPIKISVEEILAAPRLIRKSQLNSVELLIPFRNLQHILMFLNLNLSLVIAYTGLLRPVSDFYPHGCHKLHNSSS